MKSTLAPPQLPSAERLKQQTQQAAHESRPWVAALARFGFAAHGVVYAIVGLLAARAATGNGGATTDTKGALGWVIQAPFGRFLLVALAVGLLGYVLWRFVQAILDPERKGSGMHGMLTRASYALIGLTYLGLAISALGIALGRGGGAGGDESARDWTAMLLSYPFGQWLVGLAGLIVLGVGLAQLRCAYEVSFRRELKLGELTVEQERWATHIGRLGYAARGIVFGISGLFLLAAAREARAEEARGLGGALAALAAQPYGPALLGLVAVGLMSYGVFDFVQARFRRLALDGR